MTSKQLSIPLVVAVITLLLFLRALVGLHHHSGQDNYHGSKVAYGGDYEAQRHWMELTLHLPIREWYWYDLEYWGLDYPPLTAYVSYLCGIGSSLLVGPESVALTDSRGYEDATHKTYMRATVWVLDLLLYFPSVWMIAKRMHPEYDSKFLWTIVLALSQPALLLIDHGHFQYNTVSLAFALLACYYITQPSFRGCIIGSIFYCLALNFKQMTLYYAPAIFFYLLGRCFTDKQHLMQRFMFLGITVVVTFFMLWWPFLMYGPPDTTPLQRFLHVLKRIFPFQRGLFEGKVSNLWCALSVRPVSIRDRLPQDIQPLVALFVTVLLIIPACYKIFSIGKRGNGNANDQRLVLWAMTSTGLGFFLASFQVHEKSLLMALAPISLLYWNDIALVQWFSVMSTWTLWPLIVVDRLEACYFCVMLIFVSLCWQSEKSHDRQQDASIFHYNRLTRWLIAVMYAGMAMLHLLEALVVPPPNLPDLFPVLWSIGGCGMICVAWLTTCIHLYECRPSNTSATKVKVS